MQEIIESINRYVDDGIPPGDFLSAVLTNDLIGACANADWQNRNRLFDIVSYLYNTIPNAAWGSVENYNNWIAMRKKERAAPVLDDE